MDERQYREMVEKLAKNNESLVIYNSSPLHAVVIMSALFRYSNDKVRIFAENFNGGISDQDEYIEALNSFLLRGGELFVLLHEYQRNNNPKLFEILEEHKIAFPTKVNVAKTSARVLNNERSNEVNFTIGDEKMYRIEEDTISKMARCSFNDPPIAGHLANLFDRIYTGSQVIL